SCAHRSAATHVFVTELRPASIGWQLSGGHGDIPASVECSVKLPEVSPILLPCDQVCRASQSFPIAGLDEKAVHLAPPKIEGGAIILILNGTGILMRYRTLPTIGKP